MTHEHGAKEIIKDITKIGYKKIVIKGDNEPAIHSLQEEVRVRREDETVIENSPVGQSQSNGVAERAVQAAGEQLRTIKLGLENRLKIRLPATHPVVAWMANHGADVLNKLAVGPDGKTSYELIRGKRYNRPMVEFGERVLWHVPRRLRAKLDLRWRLGVYVGYAISSNEYDIALPNGNVFKSRSVAQVVPSGRWHKQSLLAAIGIPGKLTMNVDIEPDIAAFENIHENLNDAQRDKQDTEVDDSRMDNSARIGGDARVQIMDK